MLFNVSDVMKLFTACFKIKRRHLQLSCVRGQAISHPRLLSSLNLFESCIKSLRRAPQVPEQTASPNIKSNGCCGAGMFEVWFSRLSEALPKAHFAMRRGELAREERHKLRQNLLF